MNIHEAILEARKKSGLKQYEAANRLGVTQGYLSQIENGAKTPSMEVIQKIVKAYDVPLSILMFSAMTEDDVAPSKREAFNIIKPAVDGLIKDMLT